MQKVACPSTIVQNEKSMSMRLKAERSDMPAMMPGSAIGRMNRSEMASRPKNSARAKAAAAQVPRTKASHVAKAAARSDSDSAFQLTVLSHTTVNHFNV